MMAGEISLDQFWQFASHGTHWTGDVGPSTRPEAARRYLDHAMTPGTPPAEAVRLRMHGDIKPKGWLPFQAEQVIRRDREFMWAATVRMFGLPVRGSDRHIDHQGSIRWRLLGLFPIMTAAGPDITRSAAGRLRAESVWLPSALCGDEVSWDAPDPEHVRATFSNQGERAELTLAIDGTGRLEAVRLPRWGNPGGGAFRYEDFGGVVEAERTFSGYTIPARLRVGWYYGTDRFEPEGEFFRVTVDDAEYR